MKIHPFTISRKWALVLAAAMISLSAAPAMAADTYAVDPVHSSIVFHIGHFGVSHVYGRLNNVTGTLVFDEKNPSSSTIDIQVKTSDVDTANDKRDTHLRSPDFFDVKQYPVIRFKSNSVKKTGDGTYEVAGDMSFHGKTRPMTVTARHIGSGKDPWGGYRAGFETTFTIKRSDFGMDFMMGGIGDEVTLMVAVEAIRKDAK